MKKLLCAVLCVLLVVSFAACGTEKTAVTLQLGQAEGAAHGEKCFTVATVAIAGDKIVAAYIDDYQYIAADKASGVPNSEGMAANVIEGMVLASKKTNNDYYSENMATKGGATVKIADNFAAIEAYAVGKTVSELEELVAKTPEEAVDAVSGATLTDTQGYLKVIISAAQAAKASKQTADYDGDTAALKLNRVDAAAHGEKCFTVASALTADGTILLSYLDDYQYIAADKVTGVPNSEGMAANVAEGMVLASKRVNNEYYSENMATKGGATVKIADNFDFVMSYVNGKTAAELSTLTAKTPEEVVEAVSGATLADTAGYINAIIAAAK